MAFAAALTGAVSGELEGDESFRRGDGETVNNDGPVNVGAQLGVVGNVNVNLDFVPGDLVFFEALVFG